MLKFNKNKSYYINGKYECKSTNNVCTYIFVRESFNKEEDSMPIVIKVNKIIKGIDLFSKLYLGKVLDIYTNKSRDGNNIVIVHVDDVELDRTTLMHEDYYENNKDNPDIWFSPF